MSEAPEFLGGAGLNLESEVGAGNLQQFFLLHGSALTALREHWSAHRIYFSSNAPKYREISVKYREISPKYPSNFPKFRPRFRTDEKAASQRPQNKLRAHGCPQVCAVAGVRAGAAVGARLRHTPRLAVAHGAAGRARCAWPKHASALSFNSVFYPFPPHFEVNTAT